MAVTRRLMRGVAPRQVWAVLEDGRSYADWVVGTRMIRDVDAGWPQPGTRLHYTLGYRPVRKDGITASLLVEPERRLELEAEAWPMGTARITITAEQQSDGTLVAIDERPHRGLGRVLHNPLTDLALKVRNVETLRRLERQAVRR